MPRAAKIDGNHRQICEALRAFGATVQTLAGVGAGCPDIVVGYRGVNVLAEIKDPDNKGKLTDYQRKWHRWWKGQVAIVETVSQAIALLAEIDRAETAWGLRNRKGEGNANISIP